MSAVRDIVAETGVEKEVGLLLALLDEATKEWTGGLEEVADAEVVWQPFPGGHTIGALVLHIADVEAHWLHHIGAAQTRSDEEITLLMGEQTDQYAVDWPAPPARPLVWFLEQHAAIRSRTKELARQWDSADKVMTRKSDGQEITRRWLLGHVVGHESYHGGQAVLLSLMAARARR